MDAVEQTRKFFDQLPELISMRGDAFDRVSGTLSLFVHGAGSWLVTFGDHRRGDAVREEATFDADCVVVFSLEGFESVLNGDTTNLPIVVGDEKLLGKFGQLLVEPARGALGVRTQGSNGESHAKASTARKRPKI